VNQGTPPGKRRGAALAPCSGAACFAAASRGAAAAPPTHLVLQGGYDGERYLSNCHALDLRSMIWTPLLAATADVELQAGSLVVPAALPRPRALHSLTPLTGGRLLAVGGAGPGGTVPRAQLLENPSAAHGVALLRELLSAKAEAAVLQQGLAAARQEAAAAAARSDAAASREAALSARLSAAERVAARATGAEAAVEQARAWAGAADAGARAAGLEARALARRLTRAREGGECALQAARQLQEAVAVAQAEAAQWRERAAEVQREAARLAALLAERTAREGEAKQLLADTEARLATALAAGSTPPHGQQDRQQAQGELQPGQDGAACEAAAALPEGGPRLPEGGPRLPEGGPRLPESTASRGQPHGGLDLPATAFRGDCGSGATNASGLCCGPPAADVLQPTAGSSSDNASATASDASLPNGQGDAEGNSAAPPGPGDSRAPPRQDHGLAPPAATALAPTGLAWELSQLRRELL
jgi:hypothetical protein